jgi:hypothetical protein
MWQDVTEVLSEAMDRLRASLAADLPGLVAMVIVVAGAVAAAFAVRAALRAALERLGFDARAREWGLVSVRPGAPAASASALVARGAFWVVVATGLAVALAVLGASGASAFGDTILGALPRVVVAALVALVGVGAARLLERTVLIEAVNQRIRQARFLALGAKWIVLALAAAMALEQLGVGGRLPTIAFAIVVGGAVLAAALAVGLGARDAVARAIERHLGREEGAEPDAEDEDRIQHL